jgi:hypothetical protein
MSVKVIFIQTPTSVIRMISLSINLQLVSGMSGRTLKEGFLLLGQPMEQLFMMTSCGYLLVMMATQDSMTYG